MAVIIRNIIAIFILKVCRFLETMISLISLDQMYSKDMFYLNKKIARIAIAAVTMMTWSP